MLERLLNILPKRRSALDERMERAVREEQRDPLYVGLMEAQKKDILNRLAYGFRVPAWEITDEQFFYGLRRMWLDNGFPITASRLYLTEKWYLDTKAEHARKYENARRRERENRSDAAQEHEPLETPHEKTRKTDANGFADYSETITDSARAEWRNEQFKDSHNFGKTDKASNAKEVKMDSKSGGESYERAFEPQSEVLTEQEEWEIESHAKPRLFISKARTIKPFFLQGMTDREISEHLGDGHGERLVKYYCSIFRKNSPFQKKS